MNYSLLVLYNLFIEVILLYFIYLFLIQQARYYFVRKT